MHAQLAGQLCLALSEAWFCKNQGIKGTLVNMKGGDEKSDDKDKDNTILKHAVKENPNKVCPYRPCALTQYQGLVNMEVYVDDKNKVHMLVNGKEKPVTATSSLIDIQELMKEATGKK